MAVKLSVDAILAELNRMHEDDKRRNEVPVTECTTITNSYIEHTKHGVVRREVTTLIKY